jgi:hypothetical protein
MKRKTGAGQDPVVSKEILEQAKRSLEADRLRRAAAKCSVCGSECAPNSSEGLCWVCRRLKISAWRDTDTQMPAQE